jgi:hypothetical protein
VPARVVFACFGKEATSVYDTVIEELTVAR